MEDDNFDNIDVIPIIENDNAEKLVKDRVYLSAKRPRQVSAMDSSTTSIDNADIISKEHESNTNNKNKLLDSGNMFVHNYEQKRKVECLVNVNIPDMSVNSSQINTYDLLKETENTHQQNMKDLNNAKMLYENFKIRQSSDSQIPVEISTDNCNSNNFDEDVGPPKKIMKTSFDESNENITVDTNQTFTSTDAPKDANIPCSEDPKETKTENQHKINMCCNNTCSTINCYRRDVQVSTEEKKIIQRKMPNSYLCTKGDIDELTLECAELLHEFCIQQEDTYEAWRNLKKKCLKVLSCREYIECEIAKGMSEESRYELKAIVQNYNILKDDFLSDATRLSKNQKQTKQLCKHLAKKIKNQINVLNYNVWFKKIELKAALDNFDYEGFPACTFDYLFDAKNDKLTATSALYFVVLMNQVSSEHLSSLLPYKIKLQHLYNSQTAQKVLVLAGKYKSTYIREKNKQRIYQTSMSSQTPRSLVNMLYELFESTVGSLTRRLIAVIFLCMDMTLFALRNSLQKMLCEVINVSIFIFLNNFLDKFITYIGGLEGVLKDVEIERTSWSTAKYGVLGVGAGILTAAAAIYFHKSMPYL